MRTPTDPDHATVDNDVASLFSHFQTRRAHGHYHEIVSEQLTLAALSRWPLLREIQHQLLAESMEELSP
jgi:hypothetical protein